MNKDFAQGFEKVAWNPIKGLGQTSRVLGKAKRAVGDTIRGGVRTARNSVNSVTGTVAREYRKGKHGTMKAYQPGVTTYTKGSHSPYNPLGPKPTVLRTKKNTTTRIKREKIIKENKKILDARKDARVVAQRKEKFWGNVNPFQKGNTTAKVIAGGGTVGIAGGIAGARSRNNPQQAQRERFSQNMARRY